MKAVKKNSTQATTGLKPAIPAFRRQQKGAAALEYLVLAAALVLLLGGALGTDLGATVAAAFTNIFEDAASGGQ